MSQAIKFVISVHRREDATILIVKHGGFFVISRLMCLEDDHSAFRGVEHVADNKFIVFGDKNYQKLFEIKYT